MMYFFVTYEALDKKRKYGGEGVLSAPSLLKAVQKAKKAECLFDKPERGEYCRFEEATEIREVDQTYKLNTQYFNTWGGHDAALYAPGGVDGSRKGDPNSSGLVAEVHFIPFGKDDSILRPWANLDLGLQYVHYLQFNASSSNYNGEGRRASDNDTVYLFAWLAF